MRLAERGGGGGGGKGVTHGAPYISTQIFGHFHKAPHGRGTPGLSYCIFLRQKRECMRARPHNLPIMHVSCAAHVDSRRRHYVEFTLRVPDEYRAMVAAEDRRWKNFGTPEFRYCTTRTRIIAREIGRRWASFNPKMGRWESKFLALFAEKIHYGKLSPPSATLHVRVYFVYCLWRNNPRRRRGERRTPIFFFNLKLTLKFERNL